MSKITYKNKKEFADDVCSLIIRKPLKACDISLDLKEVSPTKDKDGNLWATYQPTGKIIITLEFDEKAVRGCSQKAEHPT